MQANNAIELIFLNERRFREDYRLAVLQYSTNLGSWVAKVVSIDRTRNADDVGTIVIVIL